MIDNQTGLLSEIRLFSSISYAIFNITSANIQCCSILDLMPLPTQVVCPLKQKSWLDSWYNRHVICRHLVSWTFYFFDFDNISPDNFCCSEPPLHSIPSYACPCVQSYWQSGCGSCPELIRLDLIETIQRFAQAVILLDLSINPGPCGCRYFNAQGSISDEQNGVRISAPQRATE